ncbi:MAG: hypothetical protein RMJ51_00380 [Candidatus Calescibacterium sp.]|nr:hypothetical protein [Candidatus Calescibacterium sp.]MCX7972024.1 hypothetical protein [bacterium]MDW8194692.1 hypothetical protein [Candidatus Calescibacterium sp.]
MLYIRNNFIVVINVLSKEGFIKDAFSQENILRIENKSKKDILSRIISFMSFRFIGKMEWEFILSNQVVFKIEKRVFDSSLWIKYNFNDSFYNLYRVEVSNAILPFFSSINILELDGNIVFRCKRNSILDYSVVDNFGIAYAIISKSTPNLVEEHYHVRIDRFLDSYKNYIFLSLPVIMSVFY